MGPFWALLLLLVGLVGTSTPGPEGPMPDQHGPVTPPSPGPGALSYEAVVAAAVELLNARPVSPFVLRLREAQPRPGWPSDLQSRRELSFTLEETACRAPTTAPGGCGTRWLGALTLCQGSVFLEEQQPTVELSCGKAPAALGRTRRSKVRDFFAKIKERVRGFFQCGRIWIRDRLNLQAPKP